WSISGNSKSALGEWRRKNRPLPIERDLAAPGRNASWTSAAQAAPINFWISIASMARTHHEIASCETINRGRRSQDQRQSRRGILERHEGDFRTSQHDPFRAGGRDRRQPPARQSVICDSSVRAGSFPVASLW